VSSFKKLYSFFITFILVLLAAMIISISLEQTSYAQLPPPNGVADMLTVANLSNNMGDSVYPQTESSGDNVYLVWQDNTYGNNRLNYEILFMASLDGGKTFGDVIILSNNSGFSDHPQIAVNGTNVYVIWADNTNLNRDIYLISSLDGGKTFGDVINLSNNTADSHNQEISVSGDNVYVTWLDSQKDLQGNSNMSFISSLDGGKTFGDVITLSNDAIKSSYPKISSFEDDVYISWNVDSEGHLLDKEDINNMDITENTTGNDDGIYFVKSTDNGVTFDEEQKISGAAQPGETQIASSNGNIYIVWGSADPFGTDRSSKDILIGDEAGTNDSNNSDIITEGDGLYFIKSNDSGNTFTKPTFIKENFQNPLNIEIIEYSGQLVLAIQATPLDSMSGENQEIYLVRSQDGGNSFTDATNISNNAGISECPSMTVLPNNVLFVVWQDKSAGNNEVFAIKQTL
jgi:hypothetical protein